MARKPKYGFCSICGEYSKLSFEHIPPKKAFNEYPTRMAHGENLIKQIGIEDLDNIKTQVFQRGSGNYTLCERCNNRTGGWYGAAYASFAYQAAAILKITENNPSLYYPFQIFPLRVLKQIVSMFCSVNGTNFVKQFPEIQKFILNKEHRGIPPEIRIFCYYNYSSRARQSGISSMLTGQSDFHQISEISFYPIGFIMVLDKFPRDRNIVDITDFSRFRYNDWKSLGLRIPAHEIYTYFPSDFRGKEEVQATVKKNRAIRAEK